VENIPTLIALKPLYGKSSTKELYKTVYSSWKLVKDCLMYDGAV
jgi:hypothetical protein